MVFDNTQNSTATPDPTLSDGGNVYFSSTAEFGDEIVLARAQGGGPLAYQWYFYGNDYVISTLMDGTNASDTIFNAQTNNTGNYYVIVRNNFGSATSSIAGLVVGLPPQQVSISPASGKSVRLQMSGTPNFPYAVQFATNLASPIRWLPLLTNNTDINGVWQFTETNLNNAQKFYRVTTP